MLEQLTIKNFGLIDDLSIEFGQGLNVLTGATGAGKSIIIGALRYGLGGKIHVSQVRDTALPCWVEAVFRIDDESLRRSAIFVEVMAEDDDALIIVREWTKDGRNKIRVNGKAFNLTQLRVLGSALIDFHGPHDHQLLLQEETHLSILDRLTDFGGHLKNYYNCYTAFEEKRQKLQEYHKMEQTRQRDTDMLEHQIRELSQVSLDDQAYADLQSQIAKINNAERLYEASAALIQCFEQSNVGILDRLNEGFPAAKSLAQCDRQAQSFLEQLEKIQEGSQELVRAVEDYARSLSFDPLETEQTRKQYDIYEDIIRKYGPSLGEAKAFLKEARSRYEILSDFEHHSQELEAEIVALKERCSVAAAALTRARRATGKVLKKTIEKELKALGIEQVTFAVQMEKQDFQEHGWDAIAFYISPNLGEVLKPMAEIISSGESARVMLALKKALITVDPIPVLIFDEIDAQIGGRLGTVTGRKLKELSRARQVILVTHLPQIASFADRHYKIDKTTANNKTFTNVMELDPSARIEELAHMLSGDQQQEISFSHAESMLVEAQRA